MFLYWAVLALLLLLPHPINSEDSKLGKHTGEWCGDPYEYDCKEGKCTIHCFHLWTCDGYVCNVDRRLKISAVSFLKVDKHGKIEESNVNNLTTAWRAEGKQFWAYNVEVKIIGNRADSDKKISEITDIILYMGSDFADSYEPITYPYNKLNLHLKPGKVQSNVVLDKGIFNVCVLEKGNSKSPRRPEKVIGEQFFRNAKTSNSPDNWISAPGIYRLNRASGKLTELYYDPSLIAYLM